mmetsp:Transcript_34947/g.80986  ORF Transcript_34947/g.80986 Transcript_34947/m.80986 type:complete len:307 (-) Transcript_34947:667-1587(-)
MAAIPRLPSTADVQNHLLIRYFMPYSWAVIESLALYTSRRESERVTVAALSRCELDSRKWSYISMRIFCVLTFIGMGLPPPISRKSHRTGDRAIKGHHASVCKNEAVGLVNGTIALRRLEASRPHRRTGAHCCDGAGGGCWAASENKLEAGHVPALRSSSPHAPPPPSPPSLGAGGVRAQDGGTVGDVSATGSGAIVWRSTRAMKTPRARLTSETGSVISRTTLYSVLCLNGLRSAGGALVRLLTTGTAPPAQPAMGPPKPVPAAARAPSPPSEPNSAPLSAVASDHQEHASATLGPALRRSAALR